MYAILIRAIVSAIQRISALDPKHGTRLSMENYLLLESGLRASGEQNPVLTFFIQVVEAHKDEALQVRFLRLSTDAMLERHAQRIGFASDQDHSYSMTCACILRRHWYQDAALFIVC